MTDPASTESSSSIQNEAEGDQKDSSATDNKNQDKSITTTTTTSSSVEPPASKKRVAGRQLTKDDENEPEGTGSEEPVTVGTIPKASEEVLKTRRIAKIARNKDGTVDWSKKKTANPFAAVNLVAPTSNDKKEDDKDTTTTQAKSPIFGVNAPFSGFDAVKNRGSGFGSSSASSGGFGSAGFGTGFGGFGTTSSTTSTPFSGFGSTTAATTTTSSVFGGAAKSGPSTGESTSKEALEETDGAKSQSTFNFSFAPLPKQQQQSQSTAGDNSTEPLGESAAAGASTEPTTTTTSQNTLLPTDYQPQSGEENEILLLEVKCKTHRWGPASGNSTTDSNHESSTTTSLVSAAVPPTESSLSSSSSKPNPNTEESDQKPNTTDKPEGSSSEKDATTATKSDTKGSEPNAESTSSSSSAPTTTKSDMAWHEVGIGPLRILQSNETTNDNNATKKPSVRLVQRRQINTASATKVLINQQLFAESTIAKPSDRHVKFSTPAGGGGEATANGGSGATTLLFRFGKAQEATNVASLLEQEIAKAPSRFGEEESTDKTTLPADEKKDDTKEES